MCHGATATGVSAPIHGSAPKADEKTETYGAGAVVVVPPDAKVTGISVILTDLTTSTSTAPFAWMLVAPDGEHNLVFLQHVCSVFPNTAATVVFQDDAASPPPAPKTCAAGVTLTTGAYKPWAYPTPLYVWLPPAPAHPLDAGAEHTFAKAFPFRRGKEASGVWKLYALTSRRTSGRSFFTAANFTVSVSYEPRAKD